MREFARTVLIVSAVALAICALVAALWAAVATGDRRPDVPAWLWLASAVACLASAGLSAWCVAMLDCADRIDDLHRMIEKELHDRASR